MLLADLDEVDSPRESRLVRVRRVTGCDAHTPLGVEPALGVGIYVLASHVYSLPWRDHVGVRVGLSAAASVPSFRQ